MSLEMIGKHGGLTVTIEGATGSGKSILVTEIIKMLEPHIAAGTLTLKMPMFAGFFTERMQIVNGKEDA